ncbi:MAG TPA: AIR synthase-related protein [Longimicrobiales bacterium]|nr:AIR synthase-related protein [Longimicrobiales bacterium]
MWKPLPRSSGRAPRPRWPGWPRYRRGFPALRGYSTIDGRRIRAGDVLIGVESSGLHTNGYTLVRSLLDSVPDLAGRELSDGRFIDAVMRPHRAYFRALRDLFGRGGIRGMAHITGGGLRDNLARILPPDVDAIVRLDRIKAGEVFGVIREAGHVSDDDMLRTFNLGVGLVVVCGEAAVAEMVGHLADHDVHAWVIGDVSEGSGLVHVQGALPW